MIRALSFLLRFKAIVVLQRFFLLHCSAIRPQDLIITSALTSQVTANTKCKATPYVSLFRLGVG